MGKNIFEFSEQFQVESPFENWLEQEQIVNDEREIKRLASLNPANNFPTNSFNVSVKPSWSQMLTNYPGISLKTIDLYNAIGGQFPKYKSDAELKGSWLENSCAFRMSRGLNLSNIRLPKKAHKNQLVLVGDDNNFYWGRVKELYPILKQKLGKPFIETTLKKASIGETKKSMPLDEMNKYKAKKGLIMFEVSGWGDATGHFTLWDGENLIYPGNPLHDDPLSEFYYFNMKYEKINGNGKTVVVQTDKIILWDLN